MATVILSLLSLVLLPIVMPEQNSNTELMARSYSGNQVAWKNIRIALGSENNTNY